MSFKLIVPRFMVLYADSYNIAFFKKEKDAKKFASKKKLSRIETEVDNL